MSWEIVLGIAELVAFVGLFAKWSASRAKTDAETAAALRELAEALKEFKNQSNEAHKEMWVSIDKNSEKINEHELWIGKHDAREGAERDDLK